MSSLAAAVAASSAFAGEGAEERGCLVHAEILLSAPVEQALGGGWSVRFEACAGPVELRGEGDFVLAGSRIEALVSRTLASSCGQLALVDSDGDTLALGDLQLAFAGDSWSLRAAGGPLAGKPVLEISASGRDTLEREAGERVLFGEVRLASDVLAELGLPRGEPQPIGSLLVALSPVFEPARPALFESPPPPSVAGPDVVVSSIGPVIQRNGGWNGISAYSMTTTSCNIGSAPAVWIDCVSGANCNQHPVIGQQLYRLETTPQGYRKLKQIGMSWLKHGFCAADSPDCTALVPGSSYQPNASCDWLGLFATDTYDAMINSSQGNLGPRSDVQPWTGAFTFPFPVPSAPYNTCVNPGLPAGYTAVCRRLQVRDADLDPALHPNALFAAEVVYVTTDESGATGALERLNNYSVRRLNAPTGTAPFPLSFTGSTLPLVSAVEWWAQLDSGVTLRHVDVPGDGRMTIASAITSLGGGQYHYEYALFNANSHRALQAFELPFGNGASLSNAEFSDVDYHSGEPFDGTDWPVAFVPGAGATWSTSSFAANSNANALRWGSTYVVSFDSNGPPAAGSATLTLFRPGTPSALTVALDVPGSPCVATVYCTTSTTSAGCAPTMSGAGTPSASAPAGFVLACDGLEGQRNGLIFFGLGATAQAWAPGSSSTRCVLLPVQRTPVASSGGTPGACDGALSLDWNAWRAAHPAGLGSPFPPGTTFYAQAWFHDPAAPGGTNLSDAVSFLLCP